MRRRCKGKRGCSRAVEEPFRRRLNLGRCALFAYPYYMSPIPQTRLNPNSRWCVSDPSLAPLASPPHEGEINACNVRALFSPSVRGRAAEGGRGSLTHHLELELGN